MIETMDLNLTLGQGMRELPISAHAIAGAAILVGLYIWARGAGTLRLALALLAGIVGAASGFFALTPTLASLGLDVHPLIPALGLALTAMLTAALLLKIATAAACAVAISLGVTVAAFPFIAAAPDTNQAVPELPNLDIPGLPGLSTDRAGDLANNFIQPTIDEETQGALRSAAEEVRSFVMTNTEGFRDRWLELAFNQQLLLVFVAVFGLVLGFAFGMILPKPAAVLTTSLAGSALALLAGAWLAVLAGATIPSLTPLTWLIIWLGMALLGMFAQIVSRKGSKREKSEDTRKQAAEA